MGSHRYSHGYHQAYKRLVSVKVQKRGLLYLWDPMVYIVFAYAKTM